MSEDAYVCSSESVPIHVLCRCGDWSRLLVGEKGLIKSYPIVTGYIKLKNNGETK